MINFTDTVPSSLNDACRRLELAQAEIERLRAQIREAFYAGFMAYFGPVKLELVDQTIRDEAAAWKDYSSGSLPSTEGSSK